MTRQISRALICLMVTLNLRNKVGKNEEKKWIEA